MSTPETRFLDSFPEWLRTLADDARALAALLESAETPESTLPLASALTYLFKSLDLIPDGLEDLGYADDAFVLRALAASVPEQELALDSHALLRRLADEARVIEEFLGEDYARLTRYVATLAQAQARGRSALDVSNDPELRRALAHDVREWAQSFVPPVFLRDPKNLVKLRSFLKTKLPQ